MDMNNYYREGNYEGQPCRGCGEIIQVYSRSGYCRDCFHGKKSHMVEGLACWNCGQLSMRTSRNSIYSKCTICGATANEIIKKGAYTNLFKGKSKNEHRKAKIALKTH